MWTRCTCLLFSGFSYGVQPCITICSIWMILNYLNEKMYKLITQLSLFGNSRISIHFCSIVTGNNPKLVWRQYQDNWKLLLKTQSFRPIYTKSLWQIWMKRLTSVYKLQQTLSIKTIGKSLQICRFFYECVLKYWLSPFNFVSKYLLSKKAFRVCSNCQ